MQREFIASFDSLASIEKKAEGAKQQALFFGRSKTEGAKQKEQNSKQLFFGNVNESSTISKYKCVK